MEGEFILRKAGKWRDEEDAVGRMQMTGTRVHKVSPKERNPTPAIPNVHEQV